MISFFLRVFTGKEIVFFNPHRNSRPLLNDENKRRFIFINPVSLWKLTAVFGRNSRARYRAMSVLLRFFSPRYIIDINWITRLHTLYFVWCKKHNKKFIVVQHGSYAAGLITDIPHRLLKCNVFLVWSAYFKTLMEKYNPGKKTTIKIWGNPVYNQYNRNSFSYKQTVGKNILLAPSLLIGERLEVYKSLPARLSALGFNVFIKEHAVQSKRSEPLEGYTKVTGDFFSILAKQEYDIIITDISSAMNDIIFFKSRVIFFSPTGNLSFYTENVYSEYLKNLAFDIDKINSMQSLLDYVDIDAQEALFNCLVSTGGNNVLSDI